MKIQTHFVAYVDILGFGKFVKENPQNPEKPLELLQQFVEKAKMLNLTNTLNITAFSDNIVISLLAANPYLQYNNIHEYWDFISYMNTLQAYMITGIGILPIRGGITFGDFYHDESEILFGEALVEAYDLEHLHAFYPRIVVNPKFLDPNKFLDDTEGLAESGLVKNPFEYNFEQLARQYPVAYDYDGVLYCNYLSSLYLGNNIWADNSLAAIEEHEFFVERWLMGLWETSDINMLRKYTWMKSYHNWFCEPFEEFHKYIIQDR